MKGPGKSEVRKSIAQNITFAHTLAGLLLRLSDGLAAGAVAIRLCRRGSVADGCGAVRLVCGCRPLARPVCLLSRGRGAGRPVVRRRGRVVAGSGGAVPRAAALPVRPSPCAAPRLSLGGVRARFPASGRRAGRLPSGSPTRAGLAGLPGAAARGCRLRRLGKESGTIVPDSCPKNTPRPIKGPGGAKPGHRLSKMPGFKGFFRPSVAETPTSPVEIGLSGAVSPPAWRAAWRAAGPPCVYTSKRGSRSRFQRSWSTATR